MAGMRTGSAVFIPSLRKSGRNESFNLFWAAFLLLSAVYEFSGITDLEICPWSNLLFAFQREMINLHARLCPKCWQILWLLLLQHHSFFDSYNSSRNSWKRVKYCLKCFLRQGGPLPTPSCKPHAGSRPMVAGALCLCSGAQVRPGPVGSSPRCLSAPHNSSTVWSPPWDCSAWPASGKWVLEIPGFMCLTALWGLWAGEPEASAQLW